MEIAASLPQNTMVPMQVSYKIINLRELSLYAGPESSQKIFLTY